MAPVLCSPRSFSPTFVLHFVANETEPLEPEPVEILGDIPAPGTSLSLTNVWVYSVLADGSSPQHVRWYDAANPLLGMYYSLVDLPLRHTLSTGRICAPHFDFGGPGNENYQGWKVTYLGQSAQNGRSWAPTTYARFLPNTDGTGTIEYWMFYPFNQWINNHEGDWERVRVGITSLDPNTATISSARFYFHHSYLDVPQIDLYRLHVVDGTHMEEDAEEFSEERSIDGQLESQRPGERQHPLAIGCFGQELIDQGRGDVGHAPSHATRAEPALAAEGDESLEVAVGAAQTGETAREKTAVEIAAELALEENGIPVAVVPPRLCEEGFEVVANDGVKGAFLGLTAAIARREPRTGCARMALVLDSRRQRTHRCMRALAVGIAHSRRRGSGSMPTRSAGRATRQAGMVRGARLATAGPFIGVQRRSSREWTVVRSAASRPARGAPVCGRADAQSGVWPRA